MRRNVLTAHQVAELLRNMIVSVSVVSWSGHGRTALERVNAVLSAHIYRDEILQYHVVPLCNVIGGIFRYNNTRLHCKNLPPYNVQQNNIQVLPWPA